MGWIRFGTNRRWGAQVHDVICDNPGLWRSDLNGQAVALQKVLRRLKQGTDSYVGIEVEAR